MTDPLPIEAAAGHAIHGAGDWFRKHLTHHPYHQQHHNQGGPTMHLATLTEGLVHDLEAAGVAVTDDVRKIIANRHEVVSVLAHVSDFMGRLNASPLLPLVERYGGLPPAALETVIHGAEFGAQEAVKLLGGTPPAPDAPAA